MTKIKKFHYFKNCFRKHVRAIIINVQSFKKLNEYVNKITIETFNNFQKTIEIYITTFFNNKCIIFIHYFIIMFQLLIYDKCDVFNVSRKKNYNSKQKFEIVTKFDKKF